MKRKTTAPKATHKTKSSQPGGRQRRSILYVVAGIAVGTVAVTLIAVSFNQMRQPPLTERPRRGSAENQDPPKTEPVATERDMRFFQFTNLALIWDKTRPDVMQQLKPTSLSSNIMPNDYVGPEGCADCHKENYSDWSQHSHRWMNAEANEDTVVGDFSDGTQIQYRGGVASFFRKGEEFRMRFERDDLRREYLISQTIGSRFHQYYVGVGVEGPEPKNHAYYHQDFVLPFGFWIGRKAWVPVVHIFEEGPEQERWESVEHLKPQNSSLSGVEEVGTSRGVVDHSQELGVIYARSCNFCHTTFALGDMMIRNPKRIGPSLPEAALLEMSDYVASVHPEMWSGSEQPESFASDDLDAMIYDFVGFDARQHAPTLGVSCEACHLGCREHSANEKKKPAFTGQHPHLLIFNDSQNETGRTAKNINSACGRCHAGNRPTYAGGMSTWNSTEHTDAMRGSCYSELSCIDCHDPHKSIGTVWKQSPEQDDVSCLKCHTKYEAADVRKLHTRHSAGSEGDRCLNCHMPKINEGMQDVVRTHTIFSPTQPSMVESNHPNACNLCHLEKSINWTLSYLRQWYGGTFNEALISRNYHDREASVGVGWLTQEHEATRLVAAEAFSRQKAKWGLPWVIEMLDDPYLLNRQFAQTSVESLTGEKLDQRYGYWYYMTHEERQPILERIRSELSPPTN